MTPKKLSDQLAATFTAGMATWRAVFAILVFCILEIAGNQLGWWHFDPTMIVLNTALSLWAAVQGSIIMINGNAIAKEQQVAQENRDKMMKRILSVEQKIDKQHKIQQSVIEEIHQLIKEQADDRG